jgi:hypothetical protein
MHKSATKCNETLSKWCKNKHGASKVIGMLETYQISMQSAYIAADSFHQRDSPEHASIVSVESDSAINLLHKRFCASSKPTFKAIASAIAADATCDIGRQDAATKDPSKSQIMAPTKPALELA